MVRKLPDFLYKTMTTLASLDGRSVKFDDECAIKREECKQPHAPGGTPGRIRRRMPRSKRTAAGRDAWKTNPGERKSLAFERSKQNSEGEVMATALDALDVGELECRGDPSPLYRFQPLCPGRIRSSPGSIGAISHVRLGRRSDFAIIADQKCSLYNGLKRMLPFGSVLWKSLAQASEVTVRRASYGV